MAPVHFVTRKWQNLLRFFWGALVGVWNGNGCDPSQQIQGLQCPSQPNPNKKNIETCSVKLPDN